jgi:hypothetical protein
MHKTKQCEKRTGCLIAYRDAILPLMHGRQLERRRKANPAGRAEPSEAGGERSSQRRQAS